MNRIARNRLSSIRDNKGEIIYGKRIAGEVERYFTDLFPSSNQTNLDNILRSVKPSVTDAMNIDLMKIVTENEIREALFSIGLTKAPGPDVFTSLFYQKYWEQIGSSLVKEVQNFFMSGFFPLEWNHTNLCLITKIEKPSTTKDF